MNTQTKELLVKNVEFTAKLLRDPIKQKSDDWKENAHHWQVTLNGQTVDYFTGLAFRKKKWNFEGSIKQIGFTQWIKDTKAIPPSSDDVIYSLLLDSSAMDTPFASWCDDYDYSTGSRSALAIYEACQLNGMKLRRMNLDSFEYLQELFQDY